MFFRNKYRKLSNFSPDSFTDEYGLRWKTAEHYFQAHKTDNQYQHMEIFLSLNGESAKALGKKVEIREDWNKIRHAVMLKALIFKFSQNPEAKRVLMSTEGYVEETNTWHDNYWGNCICSKCKNLPGKNMLGRFLMRLRDNYFKY
jgi:ribA/ribD-fused uncharacterized protein